MASAAASTDRRRPLRVFVAGVDGGPDPAAGVGVASSLRQAFPQCVLVAVGRSRQSSGLNWRAFDTWFVRRGSAQLPSLVASGRHGYLIPTMDDDIFRLGAAHTGHGPLLAPGQECLRQLLKPAAAVAELLNVKVPPSVALSGDLRLVRQFLRQWGRSAWLKGPVSGAERLSDDMPGRLLTGTAPNRRRPVLLQAHIDGLPEAAAFAAYEGRLLDAVWLMKRGTTAGGKTWSGIVKPVSTHWRSRLARLVSRLRWHGGGECEFIRDRSGALWLIDVNPRFPAWIHGATLCGVNLPASLIAAASGRTPVRVEAQSRAFARVVVEIAVSPPLAATLTRHRVDL